MKNVGFITVMALLMMFGCSKDDLINTEQELISVEESNQPVIYGEKGPSKGSRGVEKIIEFSGNSISATSDEDILKVCPPPPYDGCGRVLLANGNFSGQLKGFGKIKTGLSRYTFTISPAETNPEYGREGNDREEEYYYQLEAHGTVAISDNDHFELTIIGYLNPMDPIRDGNKNLGSLFKGVATIDENSGSGKFVGYSETFEVMSAYTPSALRDHTWFLGANLDTGESSLHFSNFIYR